MQGFGLLTTLIAVALTTAVVESRSVQSRTRRDIPTQCPAVDPVDTTIHLAHESNCSLFYKCYLGEKILYTCPIGLSFNPELQVCDWPENECGLTGTSGSEGTDTEDSQDSDDSEDNGKSEDAAETETEPEADSETVIPTECPAENGDHAVHIAHESDCGKFYICNHGEKIEHACPSGLGFNPALQVCDWPENVGCILSGSTDTEGSDDAEAESGNGEPESPNDTDNNEDAEESEDAAGTETESEDGNEIVIPTECPAENGDHAVHIAHESDCGKFYICNHGEKIEHTCPSGLGFNPALQVCDWPENVGCVLSGSTDTEGSDDAEAESGNGETETPNDTDNNEDADGSDNAEESEDAAGTETESEAGNEIVIPTECPAENGEHAVHIAHESDCGKFYICNHGEKIEHTCPSGLGFNPALQVCDWPENVGCILSGSTDTEGSDDAEAESGNGETESPNDTDNNEDADGSEDAEDAEESEDAAGTETESEAGNEIVIPTECPAENGEHAVHIAHESDCGKFYICNHGEKIEQACPSGLGFNPALQVCDWPENVGCILSGSTDTEDSDDAEAESGNDETESPNDTDNNEDADGSDNAEDAEDAEESEDAAGTETESEDGNETVIPTECPAENGEHAVHIAHESDCGKFYICNHGEKIEQACPSGLGFNPALQVCDWPENVGCILSGSTDTEGSDDAEAESGNGETESPNDTDNNEDADGSEDAEDAEESEDAAGTETESEAGNEIVIPTECPAENGEHAVHIAHESDCGKFYICNHGEKIEQACPSGLGFNPALQVCDWPENVGCILSGSTDTEDSDDAEAESGNDETESPNDTDNNEDADGSDNAEDAEDAEESEDAAGTETESEDGNETVIPTECPAENGEHAVHIAHESDCGKFYICNHGEKIEQACPSGLGFNPALQVCDWPENVGCILSGSTDTEGSDDAEAETGNGETESPNDTDNNEDADGSDNAEDAEESEDAAGTETESEAGNETVIPTECPAENGDHAVHIAHETDCGRFYICNHGEKIEQACPSGLGFNPALQVCDWPENVGCILSGSTDTEDSDDAEAESGNDETESPNDTDNNEDADGSEDAEESDYSTDSEDTTAVPADDSDDSDDTVEAETESGGGNEIVIPTECPAENGDHAVHIAHESNCGKFYTCNHGEKIERECPDGLEFNAVLQVCDWPESAGCTLSGSSDSDDSDDSTDSEDTASVAPDNSDNSNDAEDAPATEAGSGDASGSGSGAVIVTECPAENGDYAVHIAHESDCGKFYTCNHGEKVEHLCPSGLEFNAVLQVCDWPENAGCSLSGSSDSNDSDDSTDSEDTASVAPDNSDNSNDAEDAPATEAGLGDASGAGSGTVIVTECPAENGDHAVHIAHESHCGKYYVCNHGEKIERECPDGLEFNAVLQVCDWPESAGCTLSGSSDSDNSNDSTDSEDSASVAPDDSDNSNDAEDAPATEAGSGDASGTGSGTVIVTECPAENGDYAVHIAHESHCGKYYVCNHGEKIERECPIGLEFNAVLQVCDWPEFAGCVASESATEITATSDDVDDAAVTSSSSDNTETVSQVTSSTGDCDLADSNNVCPVTDPMDLSILFAHSHADKFCICSNGVAYVLECPDGLVFNDDLKVCDWPASA